MDQQSQSKPSRFNLLTLFAGFFLLMGVFAFAMVAGQQILGFVKIQSWQQVPAHIDSLKGESEWRSNEGSNHRVYTLLANYSYEFHGQRYGASQVTLDDSFDSDEDYWRALETQIRKDAIRQQLKAWVNPNKPTEALLAPEFRWSKLFFGALFLLVFGGFGLGVLWLNKHQSDKAQQLRAYAQGIGEGIEPSNNLVEKVFLFFAIFIFLMSVPALMALPKELAKGNYAMLTLLILPLMGVLFLYHGVRSIKRRKLFGPTLLIADPMPGCAGGQVGGRFEVTGDAWDKPLKVHISCERISRRGKNSHRDLLWQDHQQAFHERSAIGSKHSFSFDVPDHLPASDDQRGSCIEWSVKVEGLLKLDGVIQPFSRTWSVPVVQGSEKTADTAPAAFVQKAKQHKHQAAASSAAEQISFVSSADSFELTSRSGRHGASALGLVLFGVAFAGFGAFPAYQAINGSGFAWPFAVIFISIGLLVITAGVWTWARQLDVCLADGQLTVVRSVFGRALYQRRLAAPRAQDVRSKSTMKSKTGGKTTKEYFALVASIAGNKDQVLAEGIEGRHAAEILLRQIQDYLGAHHKSNAEDRHGEAFS